MRRFAGIFCLAVALAGGVAQATTYDAMLVLPNRFVNGSTTDAVAFRDAHADLADILKVLRIAGTNYGTIGVNESGLEALSEQLRTGVFNRSNGTRDSARCVVFAEFSYIPQGYIATGYRPDSIMRLVARGGPQIPWLLLNGHVNEVSVAGLGTAQFDATAFHDSVGVDELNNGGTSKPPGVTCFPYVKAIPTLRFPMMSFADPYIGLGSASLPGGYRVVLGGATPNFLNSSKGQLGHEEQFPTGSHTLDDAGVSLGADTMFVWDRLWQSCCGGTAKTATVVSWSGVGNSINDSLLTTSGLSPRCEASLNILIFGMAHFDSLTRAIYGRGLIFNKGARTLPRKVGLTIDGGLVRNVRRLGPGILADDTTSFYSTLDSLHAYHIPAVIGVNADSASSRQRDIIKLAAYSEARFCPEVFTGVSPSDSSNYNKATRFHDIFGRWNNRAFVGDGTGAGADSSILSKLLAARSVTDSLFPGRVSRFLLVPDDDYSPKQMRPGQWAATGTPSYQDSILYVVNTARFDGMRIDGKYSDANPARAGGNTNPRGWFRRSGYYGNAINLKSTKLLQHGGFQLEGAMHWAIPLGDSAAPYDTSIAIRIENERAIMGLFEMEGTSDWDVLGNENAAVGGDFNVWRGVRFNFEDYQDPTFWGITGMGLYGRQQVIRMSCADFSGVNPFPARTGWLQVKFIDSWMRAVNYAIGYTLVKWDYPENIAP